MECNKYVICEKWNVELSRPISQWIMALKYFFNTYGSQITINPVKYYFWGILDSSMFI